jgi:hypothetical protein
MASRTLRFCGLIRISKASWICEQSSFTHSHDDTLPSYFMELGLRRLLFLFARAHFKLVRMSLQSPVLVRFPHCAVSVLIVSA